MTNDSQISHCSIDGTEEIDAQTSFEKKDDSPIFIDDVAARQKERREARMRREQTEAEKLIAIDGEQKIRRPRGRPRLHPIGEKLERSNGMSEVMTQTLSSSEEERAFDGELHREPSIEREEVSNTRPYGHGNDCRPRLPRERQPRMGTSGQRNLHQNSPRNGNGNASLQQSQQRREPSPWNRQNGNGGSSTAIGGRRLPFGNLRDWDRLRSLQTLDLLSGEFFSDCLPLNFNELYALNGAQLQELATSMEEGDAIRSNQRKRILQHCFLRAQENRAPIAADGLLAFLPDGNGYLVYGNDNYQVSDFSIFIPRCLIRTYGLRRGQRLHVHASLATHMPNMSPLYAVKLVNAMGKPPQEVASLPLFRDLVPYYPTERILLESSAANSLQSLSMRIVDLLTPIGLGQRGLIVAPPKTGKTMLLQAIANAIVANRPDVHLMVLLIDERPEEVTDFRRMAKGEVFASTFDEYADSHLQVAEMVIESARRRVECGEHVVILLDSITRLARAYNTVMPSSGRVLSGGIDANALQGPKSFFGSARNIEGGGSLTILGTALIETGSRMDDVIYEEFKGTGNMELYLDRELAEKRIYPAIHPGKSGARREELLYHPEELARIHVLRRSINDISLQEAMSMLIQRLHRTSNNVEFLMSVCCS